MNLLQAFARWASVCIAARLLGVSEIDLKLALYSYSENCAVTQVLVLTTDDKDELDMVLAALRAQGRG